jgi:glucose/mannose-6-phosphate isomerase
MTDLDNPKTYEQLDPSGLRGRLRDFPRQCQVAWDQSQALKLPDDWKHIRHVVIGGMGGSAIAGDLVMDLGASQQAVPITVIRDFQLPFPLNSNHLFVASSFSGNTDETLSLLKQVRQSKARVLAVAGGGQLAKITEEEGLPLLTIQTSGEPRSALGYSLLLLLGVLARLGLVSTAADDVQSAFAALREQVARLGEEMPDGDNPAKQLAQELAGRLALIYSGGIFTGVARRWKTQLNENAKAWAFCESIPELLHNSVEAFHTATVEGADSLALILLPVAASAELGRRYQILEELLTRQGIPYRRISGSAGPPLAQVLGMVLLGDYVSYYLALIRSLDPSETPLLELGKQLAYQASTPGQS